MLYQFQVCSKVNQLYVCIYPLVFGLSPHLGHRRVSSRVPWARQQVRISCLFSIWQCVYVSPRLPMLGLSRRLSDKDSPCQCWSCSRLRFNPWVGEIAWKRRWQPTPEFLSGKSHEQRRLVGYQESDMTERLSTYMYNLPIYPSPQLMVTTW